MISLSAFEPQDGAMRSDAQRSVNRCVAGLGLSQTLRADLSAAAPYSGATALQQLLEDQSSAPATIAFNHQWRDFHCGGSRKAAR